MSFFTDIFGQAKKKEQIFLERQITLDANLEKTTTVQEVNARVQKSVMEIAWKNQELNEKLTKLVLDNEKTKNILLERENKIKTKQDELDERQKEIRKEEIEITARKAEVRKLEQQIIEKQNNLDIENNRISERETVAEKVKSESEIEKEKYELLNTEIEAEKDTIRSLEEAVTIKNQEADEKTEAANAIFEKAKTIDEEIKLKEAKFEEYRESIDKSLNEKIAEYDRRLEDLDAVKGIVDDIKFDISDEGKEAKIVVKEAIRQAKKSLNDIKIKFDELDEKYAGGTFKGFSTPLSEIDKDFVALKAQYIQIKEHIASEENLPASVSKWLGVIEERISNADKYIKSWEFSEAHRNILLGLSTCTNYELLLIILNDFSGTSSEENLNTEEVNFEDWYEILEVDADATIDQIKKAYRKKAKNHHPDKNPDDKDAEEKFKKATEAYDILCDSEKRKIFDETRNSKQK